MWVLNQRFENDLFVVSVDVDVAVVITESQLIGQSFRGYLQA